MDWVISLLIGLAAGGGFVALRYAARLSAARLELHAAQLAHAEVAERAKRVSILEEELRTQTAVNQDLVQRYSAVEAQMAERERGYEAQLQTLIEAKGEMEKTFAQISQGALEANSKQFLELAAQNLEKYQETARGDLEQRKQAIVNLVTPIKESLDKVDRQIVELGEKSATQGATVTEQLKALAIEAKNVQSEAANLTKALRNPTQRGRWGEVQLRRVAELAGMVEYCDFVEQHTHRTEDGALRPDMVVRLPGGKTVVIDSKTPLDAYLNAIETADDTARADLMKNHARQVREQIRQLSAKRYWDQFDNAPDFVVAFLPAEPMFSAALESDPTLIEYGVENRVMIVTPTSLIALLRVIAQGWRHEKLEQNAQQISDLGRELYMRISKMAEHFGKMGKSLDRAVSSYNEAIGTLEFRVLPQARKFKELKAATADDIESPEPIERHSRVTQSPELRASKLAGLVDPTLFHS